MGIRAFLNTGYFSKIFLLAMFYMLAGKAGLFFAIPPGFISVIWPASGIAIGAVIIFGYSMWPGVFIGAFALNYLIAKGSIDSSDAFMQQMIISLVIASASTFQALTARYLIQRFIGIPIALKNINCLLKLIILGGPVACFIAAPIGTAVLHFQKIISSEVFFSNMLSWWAGDSLGTLVFATLFLVSSYNPHPITWRGHRLGVLQTVAVFSLVLSLGFTLYAWKISSERTYEKNNQAFSFLAQESERALNFRIESYRHSLLGAVGFFKGSSFVSRQEWDDYVAELDTQRLFPGINGVGYIRPVPKEDINSFLDTIRADNAPQFSIHPENRLNDDRFIIVYIAPEDINAPALGLDIAFERNRHEAAVLSRDTGVPVITKNISLVQDEKKRPGFLMLQPMYKKGMPVETVEQRRAAFEGWIYAPFILNRFMKEITSSLGYSFHLRIHDGAEPTSANLIFDSNTDTNIHDPRFVLQKTINVMQQQWTLVWRSTEAFEVSVGSFEPLFVLLGGGLFTGILAAMLMVLSRQSQVIRQEVDQKTHEIRGNQERLNKYMLQMEIEKSFSDSVLSGMPSLIIEMDETGTIYFINPAATRLTGYEGGDLIGQNFWKKLMPDGGNGALKRHLSSGGDVDLVLGFQDNREDYLITKFGQKLLISFTVLHRPLGEKYMTVIIGTDLTKERKHFEQQAALEKVRALGEMSGGMAHEINNALQPIVGLSEVIKELAKDKDPQIEECIDIIYKSATNARKIVSGVLAFGRKQNEQEKTKEDAIECLSEAIWFAEQLLPSTVQVVKEGLEQEASFDDIDSYTIEINRVRLIQILTNLFSNAAYAMNKKGTLRIVYRQEDLNARNGLPAKLPPGKYVVLSIADDGCGMDAATMASAFEPFFTTKPVGEGTGLGLSIVYGIIKEWGGEITIDSEAGKGTTFHIYLPDVSHGRGGMDEEDA